MVFWGCEDGYGEIGDGGCEFVGKVEEGYHVALSWEWDHQCMRLGVVFAWLKRHGGLGLEKENGIQNGFELEQGCGMVYNMNKMN